jgi:predicted small lipoprotein YifL
MNAFQQLTKLAMVIAMLSLLAACGQKGPLYMPEAGASFTQTN